MYVAKMAGREDVPPRELAIALQLQIHADDTATMASAATTTANTTSTMLSAATPWVEKYRPKSLTDVSHQTEIISTLTNAVETNRLPHLLFYGPPGVRKLLYIRL